ncbi:MAG: hypothetical protein ACXWIN_05365 [Burkholderiaceae bacterium]
MRKREHRDTASDDLILAIGLIWGHLSAEQFEEADQLTRGCLRLWPDDERIIAMAAFIAVEMGKSLDEKTLMILRNAQCKEWAGLVLRRAGKLDNVALAH